MVSADARWIASMTRNVTGRALAARVSTLAVIRMSRTRRTTA